MSKPRHDLSGPEAIAVRQLIVAHYAMIDAVKTLMDCLPEGARDEKAARAAMTIAAAGLTGVQAAIALDEITIWAGLLERQN